MEEYKEDVIRVLQETFDYLHLIERECNRSNSRLQEEVLDLIRVLSGKDF